MKQEIVRADPVPGSNFQSGSETLKAMSRDDLKAMLKKAETWLPGENKLADDVIAEWNGRVDYHKNRIAKEAYKPVAAEVTFREEVIEELVSMGIARHVAADLTNTQVKLMAKAKEIGFI